MRQISCHPSRHCIKSYVFVTSPLTQYVIKSQLCNILLVSNLVLPRFELLQLSRHLRQISYDQHNQYLRYTKEWHHNPKLFLQPGKLHNPLFESKQVTQIINVELYDSICEFNIFSTRRMSNWTTVSLISMEKRLVMNSWCIF